VSGPFTRRPCATCGAQLQEVRRRGRVLWRCPWARGPEARFPDIEYGDQIPCSWPRGRTDGNGRPAKLTTIPTRVWL